MTEVGQDARQAAHARRKAQLKSEAKMMEINPRTTCWFDDSVHLGCMEGFGTYVGDSCTVHCKPQWITQATWSLYAEPPVVLCHCPESGHHLNHMACWEGAAAFQFRQPICHT